MRADAVRLPEGVAVEALPMWAQGWIEIQDEGSQLIAAACARRAGHDGDRSVRRRRRQDAGARRGDGGARGG